MTIHYDESHKLSCLDGTFLKTKLEEHIGSNMAAYVANKKQHLEKSGFEDGFAQMTFTTTGEENLKKLIDVSIGAEKSVDISTFKGSKTRFGILSKSPFIDSIDGKLEMPNLKPNSEGIIKFKERKLSPGLSFNCRLFNSPFNTFASKELWKMRVEGDFFDLKFNPFTGEATYSFSFGEGVRLPVHDFRNAIKLLSMLSSSGENVLAEFYFPDFPKLEFKVGCSNQNFDFSNEMKALDSSVKLISNFDVTEPVDITFDEISNYSQEICQLEQLLNVSNESLKVEFGVDGDGFDKNKLCACIFLFNAPIGSHYFGVFLVVIGSVTDIEGEKYRLNTSEVVIEEKFISHVNEVLENEDLVAVIEEIEEKYDSDYSVVTMFDKKR